MNLEVSNAGLSCRMVGDVTGEHMPTGRLSISMAALRHGISIVAASVNVPERDVERNREEFMFCDRDVIVTYADGLFCDIEVLRYVTPQDLDDLWSFADARDDHLLTSAIHTLMYMWTGLAAGIRNYEFEMQREELAELADALMPSRQRRWVKCEAKQHSREGLWVAGSC
jgi:hypothetical protein